MTRVAVILSGCGHLDGAEIRESVLSLLYLDQAGAEVSIFAPDIELNEVDHHKGEETGATRNVLTEAARIARGQIAPLTAAKADDFDALIIPGGFGVAKNLSNLAFKGADATVLPEFKALLEAFHGAGKPIGAICIAPAVLAAAIGSANPKVTIGEDAGTAGAIAAFGGTHENCATEGCVVDETNRIVTCSAYMREDRISAVAQGIEKVVDEVLKIANANKAAA